MNGSPTPFPNTRWTLLHRLREGSPADVQEALETLCRAYWLPLYAVARFRKMSEHDAQDAVQGFFEALLRRETFGTVDASQGKLRNLLLKGFEHYCINEWSKGLRQKRGGGAEHVPWHDLGEEERRLAGDLLAPGVSAEKIYAREWARAVLDRSLEALRLHYEARGQGDRFTLLRGALMNEDDHARLDQLAAAAGMAPGALRVALHRMRAHYRDQIERELAATLDTSEPSVIQEEVMELFRAFD